MEKITAGNTGGEEEELKQNSATWVKREKNNGEDKIQIYAQPSEIKSERNL